MYKHSLFYVNYFPKVQEKTSITVEYFDISLCNTDVYKILVPLPVVVQNLKLVAKI